MADTAVVPPIDPATAAQHAEVRRVAAGTRSKAVDFLRDVKAIVNADEYEELLDSLNAFRQRKMRADEVALASLRILRAHPLLLEAFYQFCPSARTSVVEEEEEEMEEAAMRLTGQNGRGMDEEDGNLTTDTSSSETEQQHALPGNGGPSLGSRSSAFSMPARHRQPRSPDQDGDDGAKGGSERVCFVNPATGQMLTGNRAPRRPETINKYLAEGWIPLVSERKRKAPEGGGGGGGGGGGEGRSGKKSKAHAQHHAAPAPPLPGAMGGYSHLPAGMDPAALAAVGGARGYPGYTEWPPYAGYSGIPPGYAPVGPPPGRSAGVPMQPPPSHAPAPGRAPPRAAPPAAAQPPVPPPRHLMSGPAETALSLGGGALVPGADESPEKQ